MDGYSSRREVVDGVVHYFLFTCGDVVLAIENAETRRGDVARDHLAAGNV